MLPLNLMTALPAVPVSTNDVTAGWPEHAGVGGLNPAALRARVRDHSAERARRAIRNWMRRSTVSTPQGADFPFQEILDHYQSLGRVYADPALAAELRDLHGWLSRTPVLLGHPKWLFDSWLPSTFDQEDGDYESFLGKRLLDDLHRALAEARGGTTPGKAIGAAVDTVVAALVADIVLIEAEALPAATDQRRQRRRTHAAVQALLRSSELAPEWGAARGELTAMNAALTDGLDTPGLATIASDAAAAVLILVPEPVRRVMQVSMLPITRLHDELMFLRCVQIFEGLYGQVTRHLQQAIDTLRQGDAGRACQELADASIRLEATPTLYRVLTTMPREVFAVIRGLTNGRSANQSKPYRQIELMSAPRPSDFVPEGATRVTVTGPTLEEVFVAKADRLGEVQMRPVAEAMRRLDAAWGAMKRTHWGITLKIIGEVPGTGGTTGAQYLKIAAEVPLFPLLTGEPATGIRSMR